VWEPKRDCLWEKNHYGKERACLDADWCFPTIGTFDCDSESVARSDRKLVTLTTLTSSAHSLNHVRPPQENVGCIGTTEIRFDATKPARTVKTAADWTASWFPARRLLTFLFPDRKEETFLYGEHITGLFASKVSSAHPRIILYDKSVRNFVQGGHHHLLTDFGSFQQIYNAILPVDGINYVGDGSSSVKKGSKPGAISPTCQRFNSGRCPNSSETCMYHHVCSICHLTGHIKDSCKAGKGSDAHAPA